MNTQHFHTDRGCLSYITYDSKSKESALIDPSAEMKSEVYLDFLKENGLTLRYIIETHTHADHVSSTKEIQKMIGALIVRHVDAPSRIKDIAVSGGEELLLGDVGLRVISTPGHTNESISIYNGVEVFSGDALLIGGTGRTDFQIGSSSALYRSLHSGLGSLPPETLLRPGHDYRGRNQALLGDELHTNPRAVMSESEFINFMDGYHPPKPDLFEHAIEENSR
ncbi:MAG: MBL fold metallo-hydrolase [Candidatus Paceibacterota bacterium]